MVYSFLKENKKWICLMTIIMMLQLVVASYFCMQKQGFHYDEYYSYYSSNVTYGLVPTDREWKDVNEIRSEFQVLEGEGFRYGLVKTMQSFDVHPPLYYMILHTICSLFPGIFSKWFGLGLNLILFAICFWLLTYISYSAFHKNKLMATITALLFGFQVGVISGITFIRMYMLLTAWCFALVIWHIPTWKDKINLNIKKSLLLFTLVMLGFLTHYYYAVFLFFMASYTCLYNWLIRKDFKGSVIYGCIVCAGMAAAVIYYPSCLSHIFRGYRGTEATGAFFDIGNTFYRLKFFTELMNQSVFGGVFWFLLLLVFLLALSVLYKQKGKNNLRKIVKNYSGFTQIGFVTLGYFLVMAQTALLNAEEANRYELPVYGFCMLLMVAVIWKLLMVLQTHLIPKSDSSKSEQPCKNSPSKIIFTVAVFLVLFVLGAQGYALTQDKVQFLYKSDQENVAWAKDKKDSTIVYLYNPNNLWMIWDESEELMQYDKIYFVNLASEEAIKDMEILSAKEVYVYTSRMEQADILMNHLMLDNPNLKTKEKIRDLLYCDLYHLN